MICQEQCKHCYAIFLRICHPHITLHDPDLTCQAFNEILRIQYPVHNVIAIKEIFNSIPNVDIFCYSAQNKIKMSLQNLTRQDPKYVDELSLKFFNAIPCRISSCYSFQAHRFCLPHSTLINNLRKILNDNCVTIIYGYL